ncbi:inner-membrane translocator [Anabaena cylindrica PCC 7122]|nr:inner-membrane translocator [Anabaena cylindrica PCC 7122]
MRLLAALFVGGFVGLLHAFLCVTLRVDQLVSGLAINLVVSGITSFLARLVFPGNSIQRLPEITTMIIPGLANIPLIGKLLFQQDILVYLLFLLIAVTTYVWFHTNVGLTLRAVGEYPQAADQIHLVYQYTRYICCAVIISGCLTSLGRADFSLVAVRFFAEGMSAGKGFIAIAALIFGRWHPLGSV